MTHSDQTSIHAAIAAAAVADCRRHFMIELDHETADALDQMLTSGGIIEQVTAEHRAGAVEAIVSGWLKAWQREVKD